MDNSLLAMYYNLECQNVLHKARFHAAPPATYSSGMEVWKMKSLNQFVKHAE